MNAHTAGPWLRDGNTIYALQHDGWRKGVETFRNRFHAYVQADRACSDEEHEANCLLLAAAPELLRALQMLADRGRMEDSEWWREAIQARDAAIAKATGEPA